MNPNWYDDPWNPAALRWWDGTQWTSHTSPRVATPWGQPQHRVVTAVDLAEQQRWGRYATTAITVYALAACGQLFLVATFLHSVVHSFIDQIRNFNDQLDVDPNAQLHLHLNLANLAWIWVLAFAQLATEVIFIIWLYKSAELAQRLGLPHRLGPIWAVLGFLLPVVNLWFPYWVAADLLPPGHEKRSGIGWWWGLWLATGLAVIAVLLVSFAATSIALVVAAIGSAVPLLMAGRARQMIAAVGEQHAALAQAG